MCGGLTPLSLNLSTRRERSVSLPVHSPPGERYLVSLEYGAILGPQSVWTLWRT